MIERRHFLRNAALLFAAPAIVRASSLMPVRGEEDVRAVHWRIITEQFARDDSETTYSIAADSLLWSINPYLTEKPDDDGFMVMHQGAPYFLFSERQTGRDR